MNDTIAHRLKIIVLAASLLTFIALLVLFCLNLNDYLDFKQTLDTITNENETQKELLKSAKRELASSFFCMIVPLLVSGLAFTSLYKSNAEKNISINSAETIGKSTDFTRKNQLFLSSDYTVIHIETTGLDKKYDEIIEISAIKFRNDNEIEKFSKLCRPFMPLSDESINLTGITNELLEVKGLPIESVILDFFNFVGDDVLIGHNIKNFDLKFINRILDQKCNLCLVNDYIDTLSLSQEIFPQMPDYKLKALCKELQLPIFSHRGLDDCIAIAALYKALRETNEKQISA